MAILALRSTQEPVKGSVYNPRLYAFDQIGKVRFVRGTLPAVAVVADAGSTVDLCRIPQGRVRVLPHLSVMWHSAWGAARVLDLGFRAYYGSDGVTLVAENATQVANDKDVAAIGSAVVLSTLQPLDFFSLSSQDERDKGPMLFGTVAGGTIPVGATLDVMLAYIQN